MVTWTFDLVALIIGFIVGFMAGGMIIVCCIYRDENGLKEWNEGYRKGTEAMEKVYMKGRENSDVE